MVVWMDADRTIEIWDLACGGDEPPTKSVAIPQDIRIADLVQLVSTMFDHSVGTFGLLLKWGRNKTNLLDVRSDLTIADLGVDFTTETDYRLLITEWPPSPSESDQLTMPRVDGDSSPILLEIMDLSRGFTRSHFELPSTTRVLDLFLHVSLSCEHKPGTFSLFLRSGSDKYELNHEDPRKLNEIGVDLVSFPKVMLLIEVTSESPTNEAESEEPAPAEFNDTKAAPLPFIYVPPSTEVESDQTKSRKLRNKSRFIKEIADYESQPSPNFWDASSEQSKYEKRNAKEENEEESEPNRRDETGYVGLVNQAMTCYLNSLIQALYMTPEFRNALYNWEYTKDSEKDEAKSIPYQLQKLFLNLQTSSKNAVETTPLTKSFGWDSTQAWQQHDIQELCRVMFDALEQKFKNTAQADLINRLYEGKMIDYVKCLECGTEKQREDTFLDIPLPVRPFGSNVAYNSVEEALSAFVQPETLSGTNQYHCETCNKKCDAHKGLKFAKFPYFLTLQLKRFDFDYNTFHRIKLNDEVTFPDVLNLNSFIPSSSSESTCADENPSANKAKSDDGSTTDSGNAEEDEVPPPPPAPPCNNGIAEKAENSTKDNYEDETDEGIERSNGPSTSSCCNSHNHENEKKGEKLAPAKGPYVYELFSIMIHSGSASGGHYYAYIKDFKTGKWLCFNDQNVSTITYDDIQKTYGGGPTRAYYSGVYSSSSNAYMLMYRQIDPARNALPMQVEDFPKHLQELLGKTQESEENKMMNRRLLVQEGCLMKVFCHHPVEKTLAHKQIICFEATLAEAVDKAYKAMNLENVVDRDQVRLVTYQESPGLILSSFEGREDEMLNSVLGRKPDPLLLQIRKKDEVFESYPPDSLPKLVYVIDISKNVVTQGPVVVRARLTQTVQQYKEQLSLVLNMDPKDMYLVFQPQATSAGVVLDNEKTLQEEGYANASKILVESSLGSGKITDLDNILDIHGILNGLILLNVPLPDVSEEKLRSLGIPSLEKKKQPEASTPLTNGPPKVMVETVTNGEKVETPEATTTTTATTTKASDAEESVPTVPGGPPPPPTCNNKRTSSPQVQLTESEDWYTPEQSNSEDSSLSYSDRTLVGDDDASEDEDDDDYQLIDSTKVDGELSSQTSNQESNQVKDASEYICRITRDEHEPDKLLWVLYDKRMSLLTFKKLLEPYVGVAAENFRASCIPRSEIESRPLALDSCRDDGKTVWLKLGGDLRLGEYKVALFELDLESETEPFRFLCDWVVSNEATVAQTKKEILAGLEKRFKIEIPYDRCRLRRKLEKTAANVYFDDQKMKDIRSNWPREIIVQKLFEEETVTSPSDVLIFARRLPNLDEKATPLRELVISNVSLSEVRKKISQISAIPDENLAIAIGKDSLPNVLTSRSIRAQSLYWHSHGMENEEPVQSFLIEDGAIVYYVDASTMTGSEQLSNKKSIRNSWNTRREPYRRTSKRTELGLKIYLDDM